MYVAGYNDVRGIEVITIRYSVLYVTYKYVQITPLSGHFASVL